MATQSDINRLSSEINKLQRENAQIQHEIGQMESSIKESHNRVQSMKQKAISTLQRGEEIIVKDNSLLHNVDAIREDVRQKMILYKNMEGAYKKIRSLKNDLRYHQGGEKNVCKMVTAMIEQEITALCSIDTIAEQCEKQYLETTYFFLSHIMMDIQLRKRGEIEAADRACKKAVELDSRLSTWVYFVIALRRNDEKMRDYWLDELVKIPMLGEEEPFLKLLAVLAICDKDQPYAKKIADYLGLEYVGGEKKQSIVNAIKNEFRKAMVVEPPHFKYLKEHVDEYASLRSALKGAMNNDEIKKYLQNIAGINSSDTRKHFLADCMDVIISHCRSPKSKQINDEIRYQEMIIAAKGVMEDAMEMKALSDTKNVADLDVEECLFKWLKDCDDFAGNSDTSAFAYARFKVNYINAYNDYVRDYQNAYKNEVHIKIKDYAGTSTFKDEAELNTDTRKVENFLIKKNQDFKATIKDGPAIAMMVLAGILILFGFVMYILNVAGTIDNKALAIAMLIIGVIGGIVLAILGVLKKFNNFQARARADQLLSENLVEYVERLKFLYSDMKSYREMYAEYDKKKLDTSKF